MVLMSVLAGSAMHLVREAARVEETDNAFVEADVHPVSSRVPGDVVEVLVTDNQTVEKGQPLARLDPRGFEIQLDAARTALAQAEARIPAAAAQLAQAEAAGRQADAQAQAAAAQLEKARADFKRVENLSARGAGAVSRQDLDSARAGLDSAQASQAAAAAGCEAAQAGIRTAQANLDLAKAGAGNARPAVDEAERQLSYTVLTAPESGRIGKRSIQTGQHVQPGQALLAVVSPGHWIVANFKENQLSKMRQGQTVDITIDAIHGRHFQGTLESFAPGTGAKFTLLAPDNATGNFTKIVQRVPVKILLRDEAAADPEGRITPGLSALVKVQVEP